MPIGEMIKLAQSKHNFLVLVCDKTYQDTNLLHVVGRAKKTYLYTSKLYTANKMQRLPLQLLSVIVKCEFVILINNSNYRQFYRPSQKTVARFLLN